LIATGSEVELAVNAINSLKNSHKNKKLRLVSIPSTDVFAKQDKQYQEAVLPVNVTRRVAIEAGITDCWHKYIGISGRIIGIDRFGESAPMKEVFALFGLTEENVIKVILDMF
jgi:transketolase